MIPGMAEKVLLCHFVKFQFGEDYEEGTVFPGRTPPDVHRICNHSGSGIHPCLRNRIHGGASAWEAKRESGAQPICDRGIR